MQEKAISGDIVKYGPRGTGEYMFQAMAYQPEKYWRGELLESWEISADKIVWHVRPGIYWAPTEHQSAWMEAREFTAEDLAADTIRFIEGPYGLRFEGLLASDGVKVIDRYTVVLETESYSPSTWYYLTYEDRGVQAPPEMIAAGDNRWENQCGTGPWMFEEYVVGSHMSFVRNPNYWKTTTIDGVEYQLPFIEQVVVTNIPDASTQLAALMTGVLDVNRAVRPTYWDMLDTQASSMEKQVLTRGTTCVDFRCDEPPFDDVMVRRALTVGTDRDEFRRFAMLPPETPYVYDPPQPGDPAYIPLEELPEDTQLLYDYNPGLAIEMLANAGHPDGLKTSILVAANNVEWMDVVALLQNQWSKIGVELDLNTVEDVEYNRQRYPLPEPGYHGCLIDTGAQHNPMTFLDTACRSGSAGFMNYGVYSNPVMDRLIDEARVEFDIDKQISIIKEATLIYQDEAARINLYTTRQRIYWWPWLKNYYGEFTGQDDNLCWSNVIAYAWIDQDLKEEMGF